MDHIGGPTVSGFYQPPPHQQPSFKISNTIGGHSSERVVIDQKPQEICDRPVILSSHVFKSCRQPPMQMQSDAPIGYGPVRTVVPSHEPSVSATSGLTVEEEAAKLLALAKMYNVDLADILRLVEPSRTPETETEGSHEQQKELLPRQSAPLHKIQARTEEVVDDRSWNTPFDILPENLWSKSPLINHSAVSPSSVFVPTYVPLSASVAPVSIHARRNIPEEAGIGSETTIWNERVDNDRISVWSRRGGSLHAAFPNSPSNSLAGNARRTSTGDRREPWSRQQTSHISTTQYNQDLENKAAFAIVDKVEGGTKEVFLRYGTHISSKAASPRALKNTNHQAGQLKNSGCGGYGTFTPAGKRKVGQNNPDGWHQNVVSWG
ncbi:hypothetical protein PILCRDRAFT_168260 [Piloderma croceum F 1598]|uniref:Uncharacterized protein n=1 Tax=Piloderma croceum (strain F 1598) TaxID=765440 RepID=A0A0C3GKR6_PILCF|nr:hypothetical protein PILCRDRAFT_168260 [Piloderma croceum F 1598]